MRLRPRRNDFGCDEGVVDDVDEELAGIRREAVALERKGRILQDELDSLREEVLEAVEDMLISVPRHSITLSALERLIAIVK
jgi:hypothetical protein